MVIDRLFFILSGILNVLSLIFILQSPILYDDRKPVNLPLATKPVNAPFGLYTE